jgi:O-antigen/teichoic acid export membrane protein
MRASLPIALYDLLNIGVMRLDVIMLGLYVGRAPGVTLGTVGIYAASVEIAGGLRKVNQAFTPIFTPIVAEQLASGRRDDAESSYSDVARWMLAVLLPAVAVLALSGGVLLSIFGSGFARGAPWLGILGAACALNAFVGLGETILMIEHPGWNVVNTAAACLIAIGLNMLLIPVLGALGAAIGMLVPYMVQGVLRAVEIAHLLDWRWRWRSLVRPCTAALLALPAALLARWFATGIAGELMAGIVYLIAYAMAWRVIGLEPTDRAIIRQFAGSAGLRWRRVTTITPWR